MSQNLDADRWARLRFAIIGPLLAAPPAGGELRHALQALAQRHWQHPTTGQPVQFSYPTLERWYSVKSIFMRSGVFLMVISLL